MASKEQEEAKSPRPEESDLGDLMPELLVAVVRIVRARGRATLDEVKRALPGHGLRLNFENPLAERNVARALRAWQDRGNIKRVALNEGKVIHWQYRWTDKEDSTSAGLGDLDKEQEKGGSKDFRQGKGKGEVGEGSGGLLGAKGKGVLGAKNRPLFGRRAASVKACENLVKFRQELKLPTKRRFKDQRGANGKGEMEPPRKVGKRGAEVALGKAAPVALEVHLRCEDFDGKTGTLTGRLEVVEESDGIDGV